MDPRFEIVPVARTAHSTLLRVSGRLDVRSASALGEACAHALQPGHVLVLNLQQIDFLSSSGIGSLLALHEDLQDAGATLRLSSLSPVVRAAIELLNLDEHLCLFPGDDDALKEAA